MWRVLRANRRVRRQDSHEVAGRLDRGQPSAEGRPWGSSIDEIDAHTLLTGWRAPGDGATLSST
jgi:hypothetical protein